MGRFKGSRVNKPKRQPQPVSQLNVHRLGGNPPPHEEDIAQVARLTLLDINFCLIVTSVFPVYLTG